MIIDVFDIDTDEYKEMLSIILNAKLNPPEKGYVHHIIPRCYFKYFGLKIDNSISNTVLLSFEDHKRVHRLAYKCAKYSWLRQKLGYAAIAFGEKPSSWTITEETRVKLSNSHKGKKVWNKGIKWSCPAISDKLKGRKLPKRSEEHCRHISEAKKGKTPVMTEDGLRRKREATIRYNKTRNYKPTEETKRKISESLKKTLAEKKNNKEK